MKIAIGIGTCLRSLLIAAFFFTGSTANAGTHLSHSVIGFSADGRFLAFTRSGVQDGSGMPYCEVYIVNVEANTWGADSFSSSIEPGEQLYNPAPRRA